MCKPIAVVLCAVMVVADTAPPEPYEHFVAEALEQLRFSDLGKAHDIFEAAVCHSAEGSVAWQQAIFGQAVCAQQITPPSARRTDHARSLYRKLLESNPRSRFAARAWLNLGRIEELMELRQTPQRLEEARRYYQEVVDRWPDQDIAGEATLRIASTYVQTFQTDQVRQGMVMLGAWIEEHPDDPLASAMWQYKAQTHFYPLEEYRTSLACYLEADRLGLMEPGRRGAIYWRMAAMADRMLNDRDVAVTYYTKIIEVAPASGKAYEAQLALKRLGAVVPKIRIFNRTATGVSRQGKE